MDVVILSGDQLFVSAASGIAGAMGHRVLSEGTSASDLVTVCDAATIDSLAALEDLDPLRTLVFLVPGGRRGSAAELRRFLHVHPRGALPVELPRMFALLNGASAVW